jgi:hypothetical protein
VTQSSVLEWAVKIVTFLFGMFGGFLTFIAPPEEANSRFAIGLASCLVLIILLVISALIKKPRTAKSTKKWLVIAVSFCVLTLAASLTYWWNFNRLTFAFPPESTKAEYVAGVSLTPDAQQYLQDNPGKTISEIVADYGGLESRELVWSPDSLRNARMILLINYIAFVMTLAAAVFCLSEGLLSPAGKNKRGQLSSK